VSDGGVLNITNGDAAVPLLRAAGVEGEILAWREVLHDGPVPALPEPEFRRSRARFLGDAGAVGFDAALAILEARDRALDSADRLVLWFEHDLYDQLQLIQVLASSEAPAELAQAETYLADTSVVELEPAVVGEAQRAAARSAWAAFRSPDPRSLEALEGDGLPFLRPALTRLLEEYPSVANGLSRSEQQALQAVAAGARTRVEAFEAAQAHEEQRFLGDASFFRLLERLEPLVGRDPVLQPTALGERVLAGEADFVTPRWIGGVEIVPPSPRWRWDAAHRRLVTMLAA
jgi:Domain of unknown function (DUF1835)